MKPTWWPGEQHESFTEWAISQGIIPNGVTPARFPGRGLGMIATRNIKKGENLLRVPLEAMFTINCVPESFSSKFPEGTPVHALFAAFFTNGNAEDLQRYNLWRSTWPSRQDFQDSMPIVWPEFLRGSNRDQTLLPPSISGTWNTFQKRKAEYPYDSSHQNLLPQQTKRLQDAWEKVISVFPDTDWETFSFHWLIVNTRSFHYLMPGEEPPEDRNDAMALLPFADYFNHSDVIDDVKFNGKEYVFRSTESYVEGEEVYMSYGPHPNDFLLAEYGFFLDKNECETLYLDDIIFRDLGPSLQEELNLHQYYGNYQVTSTGACYRTEIAACIKYMTPKEWQNYVLGYSTKGVDDKKTETIIREWIKAYGEEANTTIAKLGDIRSSSETDGKVEMLLKRWKQIYDLCQQAVEAVSC
ncbi:uncharacterized protein ACHE_70444S [Aspergillus chevalieri]|uniref:SET domain-containing protein n=1 Tax=Aspergillus chevalieri TaxID=182096 RepID=A0A7R7VVL0_ASPCH|nr:uncharacterized protein ACHE_70444S [Aspergillus chevalieri]BCR91601.1 hypothetical protein ACHE_70444S [Aspergillus chevalieri]